MRKQSATTKRQNNDIASFISTGVRPDREHFRRQDSGLTRDSGDLGAGYGTVKGKAPFGAGDHLADLAHPTNDRNYGARKRMPISAADKNDKIIEFERENNSLKEKENFLRKEITMMTTKLQRIESLIKMRSRVVDDLGVSSDYTVNDLQSDLKNEVEDLRAQNQEIKEKVRKLNVVQRGLTQ